MTRSANPVLAGVLFSVGLYANAYFQVPDPGDVRSFPTYSVWAVALALGGFIAFKRLTVRKRSEGSETLGQNSFVPDPGRKCPMQDSVTVRKVAVRAAGSFGGEPVTQDRVVVRKVAVRAAGGSLTSKETPFRAAPRVAPPRGTKPLGDDDPDHEKWQEIIGLPNGDHRHPPASSGWF